MSDASEVLPMEGSLAKSHMTSLALEIHAVAQWQSIKTDNSWEPF